MRPPARLISMAAWLLLGTGVGSRAAEPVDAAFALEQLAERTTAREAGSAARVGEKTPPHEAFLTPAKDGTPVYADKVPPPNVAERPGEATPSPDARWIEGYWDWDTTRREFVWVTGTWRVPPPGKFWVDGFWRHHENKGWKRVPGFWSERRATPTTATVVGVARDWRRLGPPPERPLEMIGTAPAPDFFYVPGEYVPQGERVIWKPGFWYRSQPGWEWNPARWVRHATDWSFREGSWSRVEETPASPPGNGPALRQSTVVSAPAGPGTAPNVMTTTDSHLPSGGEALAGDAPNATDPAGSAAPNGGGIGSANTDPAPAEGASPTATARAAQGAGTTPAGSVSPAPTPVQYGPRPGYYYPGGGSQWNAAPMGGIPWGRLGISGYLNRFLPF